MRRLRWCSRLGLRRLSGRSRLLLLLGRRLWGCSRCYLLDGWLCGLLRLRSDHQLAQFDQRELYQQLLAAGIAVIQVTTIAQVQSTIIELRSQFGALHAILLRDFIIHLEEFARLGRARHHQVAQVLCQAVDEEL